MVGHSALPVQVARLMDVREKMQKGYCIEPDCFDASAVGEEYCARHQMIHDLLNELRELVEDRREAEKAEGAVRRRLRDLGVDGV